MAADRAAIPPPSNSAMVEARGTFLSVGKPSGLDMLMQYESSQLCVALGLASENMHVILQNSQWLSSADFPGESVRWDAILDEKCPPLGQIFWQDGPLNVTVILCQSEIGKASEIYERLAKDLSVHGFNLLVFAEAEAPLYEGGSRLVHSIGWGAQTVAKVHRMVATVNGGHLQPWFLSTAPQHPSARDPEFKIVRLLSPGVQPQALFVTVPPVPERMHAICVPTGAVPRVLQAANRTEDQAVVLPGPLGRFNRWILIRGLREDEFFRLEEDFYNEEGSAFCTYAAYKGNFSPLHVVVQIFWRKQVRTEANLHILWRTVDWQLKNSLDCFQERPVLQYSGANKLRLALAAADFDVFMARVLPILKKRGMILKNEATGEFLDEDDGTSTVSTAISMASTVDGVPPEAVVVTDFPDFFLPVDVEETMRTALRARTVVGADVIPMHIKRLEWSMGSPQCPTWQVVGPGVACLAGAILHFDLGAERGRATVHAWKEYASARAAWRTRKPPPARTTPPLPGAATSSLLRPPPVSMPLRGQQEDVVMEEASSAPPQADPPVRRDTDWMVVRGKRPRNECQ